MTSREAGFGSDEEEGADNENAEAELGVFVLEDGKVQWTPVVTDIQNSRYVAITGELDAGTTVVPGPYDVVSRSLKQGDEVEVK